MGSKGNDISKVVMNMATIVSSLFVKMASNRKTRAPQTAAKNPLQ